MEILIMFPALLLLKPVVLKRKTTRTLEVTRWICYCFKVHAQFSDMHTQTTKPFPESTGAEIVQILEGFCLIKYYAALNTKIVQPEPTKSDLFCSLK